MALAMFTSDKKVENLACRVAKLKGKWVSHCPVQPVMVEAKWDPKPGDLTEDSSLSSPSSEEEEVIDIP